MAITTICLPSWNRHWKVRKPVFQTALELACEDAFGERDEALVTTMPKAEFPPGIKVGARSSAWARTASRAITVTKIKGPTVLLDGNHPLCGKALRFAITVLSVREATAEEIATSTYMASTAISIDLIVLSRPPDGLISSCHMKKP
jgi:FKBP-type peptidyl-prolyl cis-trans isomerase 2